jgi:hypothetical protein
MATGASMMGDEVVHPDGFLWNCRRDGRTVL